MKNRVGLPIALLTIFGIAVALFEAIVVHYFNRITPTGTVINLPTVPNFPANMLLIEQTREIAAIVLLAFIALLIHLNRWNQLAAFIWLFGIWTLFSRMFIKMLQEIDSDMPSLILSMRAPMQSCLPMWMVVVASAIMFACAIWIYITKQQTPDDNTIATRDLLNKLVLLAVFAVAMAHLEGVVVVYIRVLLVQHAPGMRGFSAFNAPVWLLAIERLREVCTILMLLTLAVLTGKSKWEKFAVFIWTFAIWDIFYYVSLKICTGWPESLATSDVLFLIPVVWIEPVWFPVLMSLLMLVTAYLLFKRENTLHEKSV